MAIVEKHMKTSEIHAILESKTYVVRTPFHHGIARARVAGCTSHIQVYASHSGLCSILCVLCIGGFILTDTHMKLARLGPLV